MKRFLKPGFVLIIIVCVVAFFFSAWNICEHNQLYSGFFGNLLAAVFAALLVLVAWYQLDKLQITSSADFYHKVTKDFFTPEARTLITLIECEALEFIKPEIKSNDRKPQPFSLLTLIRLKNPTCLKIY